MMTSGREVSAAAHVSAIICRLIGFASLASRRPARTAPTGPEPPSAARPSSVSIRSSKAPVIGRKSIPAPSIHAR